MNPQDVEEIINAKLESNEDFVNVSFYEIRVKKGYSEEKTNQFLKLARTKLENNNYSVYFTGSKYTYKNKIEIVEPQNLLIAIKERN